MTDRGHTDPAAQYVDRLAGYDQRLQSLERSHTHESQTPVGAIVAWAGPNAPNLWMLCDGSSLLAANYPDLFAVLGYFYGGSGANFNLPDLRSRVPVAAGAGSGLTSRPLGATGGLETVDLTAAQTGVHQHVFALTTAGATAGHNHTGTSGGASVSHTHGGTTAGQSVTHVHNVPGGAHSSIQAQAGNTVGMFVSTGDEATAGASVDHTHAFTSGGNSADHAHTTVTGGVSADHGHTIPATNTDAGGTLGAAHENMPPFVALYQIIKVLPSTAAALTALTVIERRP
jgi:microcystin-dependent protein